MKVINVFLTLLCILTVIFSCVSCQNNDIDAEKDKSSVSSALKTEAPSDTTLNTAVTEESKENLTSDAEPSEPLSENTVSSAESVTEKSDKEEPSSAPKKIALKNGLNSTDVSEVLEFYKLAAAKNIGNHYHKQMNLISMYGGEKYDKYISVFEPIAKKAIANNIIDDDPLPGAPQEIKVSDWKSAKAVTDGKYTTVTAEIVPQTDGANGTLYGGPVGRSICVLDGFDTAVNEMPVVSADFENGNVQIEYLNPSISVKINNSTGKFVKGHCKWHYLVHPSLYHLNGKIIGFNITIKNAEGYIDYTVSY